MRAPAQALSPTTGQPYGPDPGAQSGAWRILAGSFLLALTWVFLGVTLTLCMLAALLTLRWRAEAYLHHIAHFYAVVLLRTFRVRVRLVHPERLAGRRARIVALNHTSQLDMFVIGRLFPPYGTALAKREFLRVPFLGWAFWVFKFIIIDRGDLARAKASYARAAGRLHDQQASVFIAPEGTRSRDGTLQSFKKGLFHLAAESHVPIVPVIIRGAGACQPRGNYIPAPGVVEVEVLEAMPTGDFTLDNIDRQRAALHAVFVRALAS